MSIGDIGGDPAPFFIPPGRNSKNKKEHGDFSGHDLSVKKSGLSKSLPDLSKLNEKQLPLRKSHSDADLETKEHIYDIPKDFSPKEHIYDVPKDFSPKEPIYDTVRSLSELKKEELKNVEAKVGEVSSVLSPSNLDQSKYSHYDYVRKPGESSSSSIQESFYEPMSGGPIYDYVRKSKEDSPQEAIYEPMFLEEPIYESIEDLFVDLSALESLEDSQETEIRELSENVTSSLDDCISKCEEILSEEEDPTVKGQSNLEGIEGFSTFISHLLTLKDGFLSKLNSWKKNFSDGFKEALFKARSSTDIYYKQTTSPLLEEIFKIPLQSMSEEAKRRLKLLAKKQGLLLSFEEGPEGEAIVMKASSSYSVLNKLEEKFQKLLDLLSSSQDFSEKTSSSKVSSLLESFLSFLGNSSEKLQDLIDKQKKTLKEIFLQRGLKRSYSFDSKSESSSAETYKRRKDDSNDEEDDKL